MEFLMILLSTLLALVSPVGLAIDTIAENTLRSRLSKVEQLQVRVDNAPSYQLVQGKVERVRIAGRGLWLTPDIRLDTLELETDPLDLDLQRLRGNQSSPKQSLRKPLQTGIRLVFTEEDINKALLSPTIAAQLRQLGSSLSGESGEPYELVNPQVDFLDNNRLRFQVDLQRKDAETLTLVVESSLKVVAGYRLNLIEPVATLNGQSLSPFIVEGFAEGISKRYDLRSLEESGITARVLQLKVDSRELEVATFVRLDASKEVSAASEGARLQ
jgi:hypothetical protein